MSGKPEHYLVNNMVFATLDEAVAYENAFRKATGIFVAVEPTNREVTHTYSGVVSHYTGGII